MKHVIEKNGCTATLYHANNLDALKEIQDCHACVTDPPYGLSFMGKKWDYDVPTQEQWQAVLNSLRSGAHLLSFAGTRTQHRMAVRIEDAGFEIRDMIAWVYGSGFPKSLDIGKAIDKSAGAEREITGITAGMGKQNPEWNGTAQGRSENSFKPEYNTTAPATEEAKTWDGWGTALKPAMEPITLARKPMTGTVAHNILTHGTGGINIDGCRVETGDKLAGGHSTSGQQMTGGWERPWMRNPESVATNIERSKASVQKSESLGRWPANIIHDGSQQVLDLFPDTKSGKDNTRRQPHQTTSMAGTLGQLDREEVSYGDQGSAARFFYCAKSSRSERDAGLTMPHTPAGEITSREENSAGLNSPRAGAGRTSGGKNTHPTVKPLQLMRYLARLITPPQGTILDPWMGSGSTGIAALQEGFNFIGIELDPQHFQTALARISAT